MADSYYWMQKNLEGLYPNNFRCSSTADIKGETGKFTLVAPGSPALVPGFETTELFIESVTVLFIEEEDGLP